VLRGSRGEAAETESGLRGLTARAPPPVTQRDLEAEIAFLRWGRDFPVDTIGNGSWQQVIDQIASLGPNARKINVPDVRVPLRMGWPRCNRIMKDSCEIPQAERFLPV
jgi:hypothetical protein